MELSDPGSDCLINIIFVGLTKDHQFNLDWKKK